MTSRLARLGQHIGDQAQAAFDGLAGPTGILKRHGLELWSPLKPIGLKQEVDLIHLATKADHENTGEIRVLGKTPEHALEVGVSLTRAGHAAARRMGQRDHAVDRRVLCHQVIGHRVGDILRRRGRAVNTGQHADVVPSSDPSIAAHIPFEGPTLRLGNEGGGGHALTELIIPVEILHLHVVDMHMLTRRHVLGGEADDLIVFANLIALGDWARGDLVAGGNLPRRRDRLVVNTGSREHINARGHDIVGGVQAHGQSVAGIVPGFGHGEISNLSLPDYSPAPPLGKRACWLGRSGVTQNKFLTWRS